MTLIRRHWRIAVPIGLAGAAALWWLAFSFFGIQTLLFDDEVDEAGPAFASGAGKTLPQSTDPEVEPSTDEPTREVERADPGPEEAAPREAAGPAATAPPEVVRLLEGSFGDRSHPGEGTAVVLNDGTAQRFLRLEEDFATDNGPDLNVYLSAAPADAPAADFDDDFIDLGDLSGNIGSQNYEIPVDVDLDRYRTVVVWCVRFGVAFTTASLA